MIPRRVKAAYYAVASPVMRANGVRHRLMGLRAAAASPAKVQLGPGQRNYLPGWINVDANLVTCRPDIWADLRHKLPFRDRQVDCFYSHHVIEHLPDLDFHFREMHRCLKPGGVIRVGGPHGDNAIKAMLAQREDWFGDWPTKRRSIGGRFENFIFCRGEHLTILTESFLRELAEDAGFAEIQVAEPKRSAFPQWFSDDVFDREPNATPDLPSTVFIEARKP
jgi:predicted SAM-dependent methyltransferase